MKNKNPMLIMSIQTIPEENKAIIKDIIKKLKDIRTIRFPSMKD